MVALRHVVVAGPPTRLTELSATDRCRATTDPEYDEFKYADLPVWALIGATAGAVHAGRIDHPGVAVMLTPRHDAIRPWDTTVFEPTR